MCENVCTNPTFNISFLDLFTQGLANLCRHLYFGMDLVLKIAEFNNETEFGIRMGYQEEIFLDKFVRFLISQNLVNINYSDYLIDFNEQQLIPEIYAPLTIRGLELITYIKDMEKLTKGLPETTLIRERIINMMFFSNDDYLRLLFAKEFQQQVKELQLPHTY